MGHEGDVLAVAPSPDGRFLVSGSADQTVRLWNLKTRELLVTLFRGADGEWVMWTPQGFYTSSPAGARLIGWQINHGPEHEAEYVAAAQLRQHLNRPDIVARAIQLASAEEAVRQARGADFKIADLLAKPVPRLRILSPEAGATLKGGRAQVTVELEPTPDPVKLIRIQVNGRQIAKKPPAESAPGFPPGERTLRGAAGQGREQDRHRRRERYRRDRGELRASPMRAKAISTSAARSTSSPSAWTNNRNLRGDHDLNFAGADAKASPKPWRSAPGRCMSAW